MTTRQQDGQTVIFPFVLSKITRQLDGQTAILLIVHPEKDKKKIKEVGRTIEEALPSVSSVSSVQITIPVQHPALRH